MTLTNHHSHANNPLDFLSLSNNSINTTITTQTNNGAPEFNCKNIFEANEQAQSSTDTYLHQNNNTFVSSFQPSSSTCDNLQRLVYHKQSSDKKSLHTPINIYKRILNLVLSSGQPHRHQHHHYIGGSVITSVWPVKHCDESKAMITKSRIQYQNQHHATSFYRFRHLFPYDFMCQIFSKLELRDLLKSTHVCLEWYRFLMEWPGFWRQLSVKIPQIDKPTFDKKNHVLGDTRISSSWANGCKPNAWHINIFSKLS